MIAFALAKGNAIEADEIYWNMPLFKVWQLLWCYYKYNGIDVKKFGEKEDDLGALMG